MPRKSKTEKAHAEADTILKRASRIIKQTLPPSDGPVVRKKKERPT